MHARKNLDDEGFEVRPGVGMRVDNILSSNIQIYMSILVAGRPVAVVHARPAAAVAAACGCQGYCSYYS